MKTAKHQRQKLIVLWIALAAALAAFVPQGKALDSLTNGVVAYWPMDAINGNVLTPDLGPNSFDLYPYNSAAIVPFNGANIVQAIAGGPHANVNGNQNGTNALVTSTAQNTVLGYIANVSSATQVTNLVLPPLNLPNWTISFWLKAAQGGGNSGNRMFSIAEKPLGNGPNLLWDISQYTSDNSQIDHFTRSSPSVIDGFQIISENAGTGAHFDTTNVVIYDGNWHNVTIIAQTITNTVEPVIDPTQFGTPANGYVTVAWTAAALDSLSPNYLNQVDTNQNYQIEISTNLTSWTTQSTQGTAGNDVAQTYQDSTPTNQNAFYRVQKPRIRLQTRFLYVDGLPAGIAAGSGVDAFQGQGAMESSPYLNGAAYLINGYFLADTFIFGGFIRAAGEGGEVNAQFADAAVWSRALSTNDLAFYIRDGITNASVFTAPLFATLSAEFPAAAQGDADLLSWTAAKPPATLSLSPGFGDVTPISSLGLGSTNAIVDSNTVYSLIATRSGLSATGTVSVICVSNVTPNWRYIDSFTYLSDGPIAGQGGWLNPIHGPATPTGMGLLEVDTSGSGNYYAAFDGYNSGNGGSGAVAGRDLGSLQNSFGNTNTLFFRFYIPPAATNDDPNTADVDPITISVGLSDLGIIDSGINGGAAGGPSVTINQPDGGGPIDFTATSGATGISTSPGGYDYLTDPVNGDTNGLIAGHVYNVWIDVINTFTNATDSGVVGGYGSTDEQTNAALYAVWLQRDDWTARTNLFSAVTCTNTYGGIMDGVVYPQGYLLSPRDYSANSQDNTSYGPSANLKYLYLLQSPTPTYQLTNGVSFDDFYISKTGTGFGSSVPPVTAGSFTP